MSIEELLDKLKVENKDEILEFLITYSRFEYALKKQYILKELMGVLKQTGKGLYQQLKINLIQTKIII